MVPENILKLAARVAEYARHNSLLSKKDIPEWLSSEGFTMISHGASRGAVIGERWVIKYPLAPAGFDELEGEFEVFNSYVGTKEEQYLPYTELIRQGRALVLIQEAVTMDTKKYQEMLPEIKKICGKLKMCDIHEGNIGFRLRAGRWMPVVIDMGEHAPQVKQGSAPFVPDVFNKYLPTESDQVFAEGMKRMGMDPEAFKKNVHRRLG